MSTELDQTEDIIIAAIQAAVPAFRVVDTWPGGKDLERLLEETLVTPACYVVLSSWTPGEKKVIGPSATSDQQMSFRLAVISENQRSDKDGSREAYAYAWSIMTALKGYKFSTPLRGYLWPSAPVELQSVKNGYFAYGLEFERRYTI